MLTRNPNGIQSKFESLPGAKFKIMKRAFIKVKTILNSHHIIPIDIIEFIKPYRGQWEENKSTIVYQGGKELYSTETPEEIFKKITDANN